MAYGLLVVNDSGFTQIDHTYGNLQIIATGTTANFSGSSIATALPSGVGTDILVFVKPNSTSGLGYNNEIPFWGYIDYAANTFVIGRLLILSFYQGNFKYIVCKAGQAPASSGHYGLETYTSSGSLAFSSVYDDMECVEAHTYTLSYPASTNFVFNESSGGWANGTDVDDYYVLLNAMGKVARIAFTNNYYYRASFVSYRYSANANNQNPAAQNIRCGANFGLTVPAIQGSTTTVESTDTRTQIIARYHGS